MINFCKEKLDIIPKHIYLNEKVFMIVMVFHIAAVITSWLPWSFRQKDFKWKIIFLIFMFFTGFVNWYYIPEILVALSLIPHIKKGHKIFNTK